MLRRFLKLKKNRYNRNFSFRSKNISYKYYIMKQIFITSFFLIISIILFYYIFSSNLSSNIEIYFLDFILNIKSSLSFLYISLVNLFSIILIALLFILTLLLILSSLFRIRKIIYYFLNSNNKNHL